MKMSRQFPLNALRVFEAVARLGSFTKAGDELGMTQTAVSYQIKLLEANIAEPLFLRKPRRIALTETGIRLLPKVSEAFQLLGDAVASVREKAETALHINATQTFAAQWLSRHLGKFQLKHPYITVRLTTTETVIDFASEQADLALRAGLGNWPGLSSHRLVKVDFSPMLRPDLADSIGGITTPRDLLKLRIIDPADPWWAIWFKAAGVDDADLSSRPSSRMGAQVFEAQAAMAGQGVAILTPGFYADDIALGRLYQPFELRGDIDYHYWLVYPEGRRNTPKIRAFREWIFEELQFAGR